MWELPCGKSSPSKRNSRTLKDAIKGKSPKLLAKPAACPPKVYEIMLKVTMYYLIKFFAGNFAALYLRNYNRY